MNDNETIIRVAIANLMKFLFLFHLVTKNAKSKFRNVYTA